MLTKEASARKKIEQILRTSEPVQSEAWEGQESVLFKGVYCIFRKIKFFKDKWKEAKETLIAYFYP